MRNLKILAIVFILLSIMASGQVSFAQENAPQFSKDKLDQMVAPIALYPDPLLAQIMMAATYPTEVIEANRWVKQNPNLKGDALKAALAQKPWDPSVSSLAEFPQVLGQMAKNIDWTMDLGDAFLAQQADVMDAVQRMRGAAKAAGNLTTTPQQKVIVEQEVIRIEPASPQVIYVPAYDPVVVYGPAVYYPTYYYPAVMVPPPYYVATSAVAFGVGVAVGAAAFGYWDWYDHHVYDHDYDIDVDIDKHDGDGDKDKDDGGKKDKAQDKGQDYKDKNKKDSSKKDSAKQDASKKDGGKQDVSKKDGGKQASEKGKEWQHNPDHRKGVGYNNDSLNKRYGQDKSASGRNQDSVRGYDRASGKSDASQLASRADQRGAAGSGGIKDRSSSGATGGTGFKDRGSSGATSGAGFKDRSSSGATGGTGFDRSSYGSGGFDGGGSSLSGSGSGRGGRENAFSGYGNGQFENRAGNRGASSRGFDRSSFSGSSGGSRSFGGGGGGMRSGGGGHGGRR